MLLLDTPAAADTRSAQATSTGSLVLTNASPGPTNRLAVAVLVFKCSGTNMILEPCRSVDQELAIAWLKQVKSLRILPRSSIEFALRQTDIAQNPQAVETRAKELGRFLGAQRVVLASFQHEEDRWLATARSLDLDSGKASGPINISSTNIFDIAERWAGLVFQTLQVSPTEAEWGRLRHRRTGSPAALEWYSKAWALAMDGKPLAEQEMCYRHAIESDPRFTVAYDQLAALLATEGKWEQADKIAVHALELNSADLYAHRVLAASLWSSGENEQAKHELKTVTSLDPDDAAAFAHLAYLCFAQGQQSEAAGYCEMAAQLEPYGADAALVHAMLGYIYAQQGSRERAMEHLRQSVQRLSSGDLLAEQFLANGYAALKETALAVQHCERFIRLAKERAAFPEEVKAGEQFLVDAKRTLTPVYTSAPPPKHYTEQGLSQILREKLSPKQLSLTVNPLATTTQMVVWAQGLTRGATNNVQKAKMLFDVLRQRVVTGGLVSESRSLSAQEAFAKWNDPGFALQCQQVTFLFVALARAVGVTAYVVDVEEAWDGCRSPHACAVVYDGGKALLVDPTCSWFGAPHKMVRVLDDLEAIAVHLCMQSDMERSQIAAKLAPELALVEVELCGNLINQGRWAAARRLLPIVDRLDTNGAMAAALQAAVAMHEGRVAQAENLFCKAVAIDPGSSSLYFDLGNAYAAEGRPNEARKSFENALRCPHTKQQAEVLEEAIRRIGDAGAGGASIPGISARK